MSHQRGQWPTPLALKSAISMVAEKDTPDRNQKWNPTIGYGLDLFADLPGNPGSEPKNGPPRNRVWTGSICGLDPIVGFAKRHGLVVGVSVVLKWRVYLTIKIWMVSDHVIL